MTNNKLFQLSLLSTALALPQATVIADEPVFVKSEQRFIVQFKTNTFSSDSGTQQTGMELLNAKKQLFSQTAASIDATIVQSIPESNIVAMTLDHKQKAALLKNPSVASVEVDPKRYLQAESTPYGITMVQANQLSDAGTVNQKVCVVDTGYTLGHSDLPNSGVTGNGNSQSGSWSSDGNGHGTHVAGTIAAIGGNGQGVVGVNPSGKLGLHIVKVFNDSGQWVYGSDLVLAIQQCQAAGSTVISMSLGGGGSSTAEQSAFDSAYASGILNVAAAGNDGNGTFSYPASYNSVMSVAAVDSGGSKANFSQYNSQVEIAAPGVSVNSTYNNGGYQSLSGTSMATPHVSGVAALVWGNNPQCSVQQLRDGLNATALDKGSSGRDSQYGYGIVQAKAASDYLQTQCGTTTDLPPNASFSVNKSDLTVSLSNSSSDDKGISSYEWSFGDGNTSTQANPSHTYAQAGTYSISLRVTDTAGQTDDTLKSVTVSSGDQCLSVAATHPSWDAATMYSVGDKVSYNGKDYEATWWSQGASPAIYTNVWKVIGDSGDGDGDGDNCGTENEAPVANFSVSTKDLTANFTNSSTDDNGISSYSWSFGDGYTSNNANPSHTYANEGSYTVSLTVTDSDGESDSTSRVVTVSDGDVVEGCDGIDAWSSTTSYVLGDKVSFNGKKYEAIWWSTGASPDVFSNVWKYTGNCQ